MMHLRALFYILFITIVSSATAQTIPLSGVNHAREREAAFARMRAVDSTDIVFLGDDNIEYAGDWNKLLGWKHVRNRGIAGDRLIDVERRLSAILRAHPKRIYLQVGMNDILAGTSAESLFAQYKSLLDQSKPLLQKTVLIVQSLLPLNASRLNQTDAEQQAKEVALFNQRLRRYCQQSRIPYLNIYAPLVYHQTTELRLPLTSDGVHLTAMGYKIWAFTLKKQTL